MDTQSLDTLLNWLQVKPQTLGWGALVAYDRAKANLLLAQEYIDRFNENGSYLPPFTESIPSGDTHKEFIYDYVVATPILSFENSSITTPRARLTFAVVGGTQLSLETPLGASAPEVTKLVLIDSLDTQSLMMDIDLAVVEGQVDGSGQVQLDLEKATNWVSSMATTAVEQRKIGEYLQELFMKLEKDYRIFVLNTVKAQDGQFIQPYKFGIRTHPKPLPGGQLRGERGVDPAAAAEGAVLLFVAMDGYANGSYPAEDRDLMYLIPDGQTLALSASIILGHEYLFDHIFTEGFARMNGGGKPDITAERDSDKFVKKFALSGGIYRDDGIDKASGAFSNIRIPAVELAIGGSEADGSTFSLAVDRQNGMSVTIAWRGHASIPTTVTDNVGIKLTNDLLADWNVKFKCQFEMYDAQEDGFTVKKVRLVEQDEIPFLYRITPGLFAHHEYVAEHFIDLNIPAEELLASTLHKGMNKFLSASAEIDPFRLNSLLFQGGQSVDISDVHFPGDLAFFGRIAPTRTEFAITPLNDVVGVGATKQFATIPVRNDIEWRVENTPGSTSGIGFIDQSTGLFTAPAADQIEGIYTRIKVIAETLDGHTVSALVTVVVNAITVNPLVQTCSAGDSREMSAGSLGGEVLNWSIGDPDSDSSIIKNPDPTKDHTYTAGRAQINKTFTVDKIIVGSSTASVTSYVLVVHDKPQVTITVDLLGGDNEQVQLSAIMQGTKLDDVTWSVLMGSGTIDDRGVYTVVEGDQYKFAIVTAQYSIPVPALTFEGYIILPLPLVKIPSLVAALNSGLAI